MMGNMKKIDFSQYCRNESGIESEFLIQTVFLMSTSFPVENIEQEKLSDIEF